MPNEWDAYLLRMGRKAEIGAGAANEFNLDELRWTEVENENAARGIEGAAERKHEPKTIQSGDTHDFAGTTPDAMNAPRTNTPPKKEGLAYDSTSIIPNGGESPGTERLSAKSRQANRPPEHVARKFPERARQFMPFAALKGYEEMLAEVERNAILASEGRQKKHL